MFFSHKANKQYYAVVDITSSSVGGAYVGVEGTSLPKIIYSVRLPVRTYGNGTSGMLRTLDALLKELSVKGGPVLKKAAGQGGVSHAVVYLGSPWQVQHLHVETLEKEKPFIFTKAMLDAAYKKGVEEGETGCTLVASILNGYEVTNPVGKKAKRADIFLLSVSIDEEAGPLILRALKGFIGSSNVQFVPFAGLMTGVFKSVFPHEDDFLALQISASGTSMAFVRAGMLAGVRSMRLGSEVFLDAAKDTGISSIKTLEGHRGLIDKDKNARFSARLLSAKKEWITEMREALKEMTAGHALPRTLFLFTEHEDADFFKQLLNAPELHELWLSDEPLRILHVSGTHFDSFITHEMEDKDSFLDLLALYARYTH